MHLTISFGEIYYWLTVIANIKVYDVLLCRIIALPVAFLFFWFARQLSMPFLKAFGGLMGLIVYGFSEIVKWMVN